MNRCGALCKCYTQVYKASNLCKEKYWKLEKIDFCNNINLVIWKQDVNTLYLDRKTWASRIKMFCVKTTHRRRQIFDFSEVSCISKKSDDNPARDKSIFAYSFYLGLAPAGFQTNSSFWDWMSANCSFPILVELWKSGEEVFQMFVINPRQEKCDKNTYHSSSWTSILRFFWGREAGSYGVNVYLRHFTTLKAWKEGRLHSPKSTQWTFSAQ